MPTQTPDAVNLSQIFILSATDVEGFTLSLTKSSLLTLFPAHPLLFPVLSLSFPALCICRSFPRNPLGPASDSAPSAPAGSPEPPSPVWNPLCDSPTPGGVLSRDYFFSPFAN